MQFSGRGGFRVVFCGTSRAPSPTHLGEVLVFGMWWFRFFFGRSRAPSPTHLGEGLVFGMWGSSFFFGTSRAPSPTHLGGDGFGGVEV